MSRRNQTGFTLIELLVVIAVIGIVTAVAIPNLLNGIDRGKQKRTMADLHAIGTAIEMYSVDHNVLPVAGTIGQLATALEPDYILALPERDGWGHAFLYAGALSEYTVGSPGKDGGSSLSLNGAGGPQESFDADIIFSLGQFVQWPEGLQESGS